MPYFRYSSLNFLRPYVLVLTCALNVAPGDFGRARIRADERLHIRVALSTLEDLHWGNEQAFLKQIGCVATVGSGDFPAKVGLVGDVADECGQPFAREYRRDHGDVGRMILAGPARPTMPSRAVLTVQVT